MIDWQQALIGLPILFLSLTVHEFAHAWAANKLGDPTARLLGRMSLNPIVHIDLMGLVMMVASGFRFGWAKPVPVNPANFRNWRQGMLWVSLAGPISNIILATGAAVLFRLLPFVGMGEQDTALAYQMVYMMIFINCALAFFNMIPLPPLDGSKVLIALLPPQYENFAISLERYGPMVLLGVIFLGFIMPISPIWTIIGPFVKTAVWLYTGYPLA
ncbi:MAG: site-2 protease family protein [bacterium]|nr:site-2 protease family protein [bacterium]